MDGIAAGREGTTGKCLNALKLVLNLKQFFPTLMLGSLATLLRSKAENDSRVFNRQ